MNRICTALFAILFGTTVMFAEDMLIIGKDTKVFETTVAKDEYAAVNQNDEPVILRQGMTFGIKEKKAGWYVVEYTSGLRGMVMQNVVADDATVKNPTPGTYKVTNNPTETVTITNNGSTWNLTSGNKSFSGATSGKSVTFTNANGNVEYTLVNISGKPMVYNYNNSVTKFF